jgi:hypothetical protein
MARVQPGLRACTLLSAIVAKLTLKADGLEYLRTPDAQIVGNGFDCVAISMNCGPHPASASARPRQSSPANGPAADSNVRPDPRAGWPRH